MFGRRCGGQEGNEAQGEAAGMMSDPKKRGFFEAECAKLGLDPLTATTFDWLEADDRAISKGEGG